MVQRVTSAIGTLKGPLHGGANEGVIKMLQEIGDLEKVDAYVDDCLANKRRIMGIGHRVYRVLDPARRTSSEWPRNSPRNSASRNGFR